MSSSGHETTHVVSAETLSEDVSNIGLLDARARSRVYYDIISFGVMKVRLLYFKDATPSSARSISLETYYLSSAPPYRALSYTWGPSTEWTNIWLNGELFVLSESLSELLCLFQQRHPREYLWVDQICINQSDAHEKSIQVSLMQRIFSKAMEVIVWLRPIEPSPITCDTSGRKLPKEAERHVAALLRNCTSAGSTQPGSNILASRSQSPGRLDRYLDAFMDHRYWTRTWTIQELLTAKKLIIYWGEEIILWKEFKKFALSGRIPALQAGIHKSRQERVRRRPGLNPGHVSARAVGNARKERLEFFALHARSGKILGPREIIFHVQKTKSKDPRDAWYAVQGILSTRYRMVVNYRHSTSTVFLHAAEALLKDAFTWETFMTSTILLAKRMELLGDEAAHEERWNLQVLESLDSSLLTKLIELLKIDKEEREATRRSSQRSGRVFYHYSLSERFQGLVWDTVQIVGTHENPFFDLHDRCRSAIVDFNFKRLNPIEAGHEGRQGPTTRPRKEFVGWGESSSESEGEEDHWTSIQERWNQLVI